MERQEILDRIRKVWEHQCPSVHLSVDHTFNEQGFDSLDRIELAMAIETEFSIALSDDETFEVRNAEQLADIVERKLIRREREAAARRGQRITKDWT